MRIAVCAAWHRAAVFTLPLLPSPCRPSCLPTLPAGPNLGCSIAGREAYSGGGGYCASKHALEAFATSGEYVTVVTQPMVRFHWWGGGWLPS